MNEKNRMLFNSLPVSHTDTCTHTLYINIYVLSKCSLFGIIFTYMYIYIIILGFGNRMHIPLLLHSQFKYIILQRSFLVSLTEITGLAMWPHAILVYTKDDISYHFLQFKFTIFVFFVNAYLSYTKDGSIFYKFSFICLFHLSFICFAF